MNWLGYPPPHPPSPTSPPWEPDAWGFPSRSKCWRDYVTLSGNAPEFPQEGMECVGWGRGGERRMDVKMLPDKERINTHRRCLLSILKLVWWYLSCEWWSHGRLLGDHVWADHQLFKLQIWILRLRSKRQAPVCSSIKLILARLVRCEHGNHTPGVEQSPSETAALDQNHLEISLQVSWWEGWVTSAVRAGSYRHLAGWCASLAINKLYVTTGLFALWRRRTTWSTETDFPLLPQ